MKTFLWMSLCLWGATLLGQDYRIDRIPAELKQGADAVVRLQEATLTVDDESQATYQMHRVVSILNEGGEGLAEVRIGYDDFIEVSDIEAYVYDAKGKQVAKLRRRDIEDLAAYSQSTLASSSRLKSFDLRQPRGPYTIEYRFTQRFKGTFFLPGWSAGGYRIAVERGSFQLRFPADLQVRHQARFLADPQVSTEEGLRSYRWEVAGLTPLGSIPAGPSWRDQCPDVRVAMSQFEMEGYAGDMSTWQGLGQWLKRLLDETGALPEAAQAEARAVVATAQSRADSVRLLYQYMQGRTRYVSIQLGIGGWQPFAPAVVHEKQYGDCKALSYYMHTLLQAVGIESHYAVVEAGRQAEAVRPEFPSNQFNHVILCVPGVEEDTLWLECTSQTQPFGFLGSFTDDRDVLLVTEQGGQIGHTTSYAATQNLHQWVGALAVDEKGEARGTLQQRYQGLGYEHRGLQAILRAPEKERRDWLSQGLGWDGWFLGEFTFADQPGPLPEARVDLELAVPNLGTRTGSRLFLTLNARPAVEVPPLVAEREWPIFSRRGYTHDDSLVFTLPTDFRVEYLPEPVELVTPFGYYRVSYELAEGQLKYRRELLVLAGEYEPEQYAAYRSFWQQVAKQDQEQLVLVQGS